MGLHGFFDRFVNGTWVTVFSVGLLTVHGLPPTTVSWNIKFRNYEEDKQCVFVNNESPQPNKIVFLAW
jgi:hypothetical protein